MNQDSKERMKEIFKYIVSIFIYVFWVVWVSVHPLIVGGIISLVIFLLLNNFGIWEQFPKLWKIFFPITCGILGMLFYIKVFISHKK